ncbi:MAG: hypothetical protein A3F46_01435 [Legionellales bacterium RIFCSPHIGHO2_12_FULL_42_9]|nr:MAG: hypothetical protein A3F46_01435 [Legionellales bacterium RIFCSPHIGHO2_12_FULL_42_9]
MRFLLLLTVLLLSSCQSNLQTAQTGNKQASPASKGRVYPQEKDGAPLGPIPSFFKKLIPIHEPYSRYGNPDSYRVAGRQYTILQTASGYKARGIASWYGTKFHKQRTSSGDAFDMYAMTAAHKTLPLPSYVRVKNLENGREAVLRVNDRGPFRHDRIIDLSYAAAAKLGLLPKGTARVEVESIVPAGSKVAHYYIQAGAFNTSKSADELRRKLIKLTSSRVFVEKYQRRYLVKVGPFAAKSMTTNLQKQLALNGVKGSFSMLQ